ncbi:ImmA/IrrE family metallo-endopeptidase [Nocardia sp. CA-119907]|uniref:ImmA/IrrE family metallo-endopeptidase n=1 Tax=Nocardia sp. CA-119907 TaxID=3239973 RepID=UPI003D95BD24
MLQTKILSINRKTQIPSPTTKAQYGLTITELRSLIPRRTRISVATAMQVAEQQADALVWRHKLSGSPLLPIPATVITEIKRLLVIETDQEIPGVSMWDRHSGRFEIQLARTDIAAQRFTLACEFKHILDYDNVDRLYRGSPTECPASLADRAADYFAACLLVPTELLKQAWRNGVHTTKELARLFVVSESLIRERLDQAGLSITNESGERRHLLSGLPVGVAA